MITRINVEKPTWQKYDGYDVKRIKDSNIIACPHKNKKSKWFDILDLSAKERVCVLKDKEVDEWLMAVAKERILEEEDRLAEIDFLVSSYEKMCEEKEYEDYINPRLFF